MGKGFIGFMPLYLSLKRAYLEESCLPMTLQSMFSYGQMGALQGTS
jgi:hypothetical protein